MNSLIAQLSEPFPPSDITWKPGATTKDGSKCMALAYGDLRAYQDRLDAVCGLDWSVEYQTWGDRRIIARLTIQGVTRASTGEMDAQDEKNNMGGTVAEAQAFKRAAAMFGLGRYLYDLPSVWVEFDAGARRISKAGTEELDRRYREWYTRKVNTEAAPVQAAKAQVKHRTPATNGTPPAQPKTETPKLPETLRKALHAIGHETYGAEWDARRKKLVTSITKGRAESSNDLTPEEAQTLIDGMQAKAAAKTGEKVAA